MATFLPYIAMASSAVSGFASMRASQSEANALDAQASQSEFQGRVNALQHRKQGNEILRRMNSIIATNIARGSARGLNPLASGEAVDMVNAYNRKYGVDELNHFLDIVIVLLRRFPIVLAKSLLTMSKNLVC